MDKENNKIEVSDLHKAFGRKRVLNGVDLKIKKGESLVVIGGSGTGKSVLIKCIQGLIRPDSGSIKIDGFETVGAARKENEKHYAKMGMLFQGGALFDSLSVWENVAFGLKIRKLPKDEIKRRVTEMLELVNLAGYEKRYIDQLSGGQQQRVAIARALATDPEIIYFDEPTSALDPELTGEVLSVMRKLAEEGMTMLVVTHEMGFARNVSSKTVFMENGVVVEQAPSHEFFAHPREERTREFLRKIEHTA